MTDRVYCYPPDYGVLSNKADIRDGAELERFERLHTASRMLDCPTVPITYEGYRALHRHIFQDVYPWAGEARVVDIQKADLFAHWRFVNREMEKRFALLDREGGLRDLPAPAFAERAATHIAEINAIHPFREGNGRIQRLFLKQLAAGAGLDLQIGRMDREGWMRGCIAGMRERDYGPMRDCIAQALSERQRARWEDFTRKRERDGYER
jgi:cell filamentation protein